MIRIRPIGIALAAAAAVAFPVTSAVAATAPVKLAGTVGPGFTITLTRAGKPVKAVKAGKVTITVADNASFHNFVLEQESGGKLDKEITGVEFTGTRTVTLTLAKGSYKFYCAPHEGAMFGTFTVS